MRASHWSSKEEELFEHQISYVRRTAHCFSIWTSRELEIGNCKLQIVKWPWSSPFSPCCSWPWWLSPTPAPWCATSDPLMVSVAWSWVVWKKSTKWPNSNSNSSVQYTKQYSTLNSTLTLTTFLQQNSNASCKSTRRRPVFLSLSTSTAMDAVLAARWRPFTRN